MRGNLFQINGKKSEPLVLPEAAGPPVTLSEKVYVPIKEHPDVSSRYTFSKFQTGALFFVFGKARGVDPFFFAFSWGGEGEEGPNRGNRTWRHLSL